MLQSQLVDLVFTSGADTKTDNKNTLYTSFTEMKNSRTDLLGAVRPRGGITENILASTQEIPEAGDSFGVVANDEFNVQYSKGVSWRVTSTSETVSGSELRGDVSRQVLGNNSSRQVASAIGGGEICTAWLDTASTSTYLVVSLQTTSGETIVQEFVSGIGVPSKLVVCYANSRFYVIYQNADSGGTFYGLIITKAETGVIGGVTWTGKPASGAAIWDADSDGTFIYLYTAPGVTTTPSLYKITPSGSSFTTSAPVAVATGIVGGVTALSCTTLTSFATGAVVAVTGASESSSAYLQFFNNSLTQVGATKSTATVTGFPRQGWLAQKDTTNLSWGFVGPTGTNQEIRHNRLTYASVGDSVASVTAINSYFNLLTKPAYIDNRLMGYADTATVATYGSQAIVDLSLNSATVDPAYLLGVSKNLGAHTVISRPLPKVLVDGSDYYFPVAYIGAVLAIASTDPAAGAITRAQITPQIRSSLVKVDQSKYPTKMIDSSQQQGLAIGSVPRPASAYRQIAHPWPELGIDLGAGRVDVAAGSFTGTVSCVFAKVLTFPDGSVYRSYGPIFTADLAAQAIRYTLTANDFSTTGHFASAQQTIEFYKTEQNGTIFYKAADAVVGTTIDAVTDTTLILGRLADINGNELYPEPPPGIRCGVKWKDRLAVVGADSPNVIKFEKPAVAPQGTSFADGLELAMDSEGGGITALGAMDSALYVFKKNLIATVYGDPAGATGDNGTLSVPTILRNGLGTEDPRSVILTPRGLMFNSQKGFYIILRNQEWQFAGSGPYADRSVLLTGATIDIEQAEVYFSYEDGSIWAYNYESNQWYKWLATDTIKGIAMHNHTLVGSSDFGYWEYSKGATVDEREGEADREIPQTYRTGWIRTSHIRGYQRVKRAYFTGQCLQSCTLTIDIYVDNSTTSVQTFTFNLTPADPIQLDMHLAVQKCEAMQFKFTTNKAGLVLSGGTLDFGVKQGPDKSRTSASNYK